MRHPLCSALLDATLAAAGCGVPEAGVPAIAEGTIEEGTRTRQDGVRCPDPESECTTTNGPGVYHVEGGSSGLDYPELTLFITRFDNHAGSDVTFAARVYSPTLKVWKWLSPQGSVVAAEYAGKPDWHVTEIQEKNGEVGVTLYDKALGTVYVGGGDLLNLSLRLEVMHPDSSLPFAFRLEWKGIDKDVSFKKYAMLWRFDYPNSPTTSYCRDENGLPDEVVFQQGLWVHPHTGRVKRDNTTAQSVTMSCRLGAPATCQGWGYGPMSDPKHFDPCIPMKRADYCGDGNVHTVAGTKILIADDAGIQQSTITATEAVWEGTQAKCINKQRHPDIPFSGFCNGVALPPCPQGTVGNLVSGIPQ